MKQNIKITLLPLYTITEHWFSINLSQFSDALTNYLIARAETTNSVTVQSDCFTALHSLQKSTSEAIPLFITTLAKNFQTSRIGHTLQGELDNSTFAKRNKKDALNLITTEDWEENLSFDTAIEKIIKQNHEAFDHLETRIFALLKSHGEHIEKSPLGAENILTAFRDSMEPFDFSPDIRIHVYKFFEQFISTHIAELLEKLNVELVKQGILPEIRTDYAIKKQKNKSQTADQSILNKPEPENQTPVNSEFHQPPSYQATPYQPVLNQSAFNQPAFNQPEHPDEVNNSIFDNSVNSINPANNNNIAGGTITPPVTKTISEQQVSSLNSRYLDLANQLAKPQINRAIETPSQTIPEVPSQPLYQANSGEQINNNISRGTPESSITDLSDELSEGQSTEPDAEQTIDPNKQLNKLLGHTNRSAINSTQYSARNNLLSLKKIYADKQQSFSSSEAATFVNEHDATTKELINALAGIQYNASPDQDHPDESPVSVQQKIKDTILARTNKSPETTQLKNNKLYLIDMIEDLFTHIADNKKLSLSAKGLFRNLIIPIIHLALIDDTFIDNETHPARFFLDDFSDASLGITDSETNSNNPIYLKLKKITSQLSEENKINSAVFSALNSDLKRFVNYRKQLANSNAQSSSSSAEKKINSLIVHSINDKKLPEGVTLILNKIWKNVMLNIYQDNSCDADDRERTTAFMSSLIFSIQPALTSIEKNRLERLIPIINRELEDGLIRVNCPSSIKEKITLYLKKLHHSALCAASPQTAKDDLASESDEIIYRNELFEDIDTKITHENNEINMPSEALDAAVEELILFDKSINKKPVTTIVSSLEEAFIETNEPKKEEFDASTVSSGKNIEQKINTPQKESKTDFELIRLVNNSYKMERVDDEYTSKAKNITEDTWLEFHFKSHFSRARVTWIEDDHSQYNCLTHNNRLIEMSLEALSDSLRQDICSVIQSSLINEAIKAVSDATSSKD